MSAEQDLMPVTLKEQALEVLVFLFLIVPSTVLPLFWIPKEGLSFVFVAVRAVFRDLALVSLIFFFVWRNREGLRALGLTSNHFLRELGLGVVLFIPFSLAAARVAMMLEHMGFSAPKVRLFTIPAV